MYTYIKKNALCVCVCQLSLILNMTGGNGECTWMQIRAFIDTLHFGLIRGIFGFRKANSGKYTIPQAVGTVIVNHTWMLKQPI